MVTVLTTTVVAVAATTATMAAAADADCLNHCLTKKCSGKNSGAFLLLFDFNQAYISTNTAPALPCTP